MKPTIKLATIKTPDGGEMVLYKHDHDFSIQINGHELMNNRQHESEMELARLGCAHLTGKQKPQVMIGGLGMGYTLRQTLDMLSSDAKVVVSELLPAVFNWNQDFLGELNNHPLDDQRAEIIIGDIYQLLSQSKNKFDTILLDIDNGPSAIVDSNNQRLYTPTGIQLCRQALRNKGCLAVWSGNPSKAFEQVLTSCGFHVQQYQLKPYKRSKKASYFVWVASEDIRKIPPSSPL
ncbi:MAG TPA: MnmC family methyltransferase [Anaerolineales bacterium]|nr:MnmC family methyltransferase [Anaerolineales bacterium]